MSATAVFLSQNVAPASAHYTTTRCDDDDECYTVRCDDDGDECWRVSSYSRNSYDRRGFRGGYSGGYGYGDGYNNGYNSYYNNDRRQYDSDSRGRYGRDDDDE